MPGRKEIIVGASPARQYAGLDVGDSVQVRTATLVVVGHFVAEGGAAESEIWMDRVISQSVFRRTSTVSVARVKLASDVDVQALNQRLTVDPRLTSTLIREQEFFAAQSESRAALIDAFAHLIAGIMALGSVFGALATMFTAVSRRSVEIATLRALGFQAGPVVVSVLVEATVLALAGGVLGAARRPRVRNSRRRLYRINAQPGRRLPVGLCVPGGTGVDTARSRVGHRSRRHRRHGAGDARRAFADHDRSAGRLSAHHGSVTRRVEDRPVTGRPAPDRSNRLADCRPRRPGRRGRWGWRWWKEALLPVVRTVVVRQALSADGQPMVLNASGYVPAHLQSTVSSKVTGRIVDVLVEEGTVTEGSVLARLDNTTERSYLALAEVQLGQRGVPWPSWMCATRRSVSTSIASAGCWTSA